MSPEIISQWEAYLAEERVGVRSQALVRLDAFVASLKEQKESDWQDWAVALSESIVDGGCDIPVRFPLFRRVIFPALHNRLSSGSGAAARLLAGFGPLLYQSQECQEQLPGTLRSELGLILEAIRRDPSDIRAKHKLRGIYRDRFNYCLHEIPSGILYALNGATLEQCSELIEEVGDYSRLCEDVGYEPVDREIIGDSAVYIPAYRDFLTRRESYESFENYLKVHSIGRDR